MSILVLENLCCCLFFGSHDTFIRILWQIVQKNNIYLNRLLFESSFNSHLVLGRCSFLTLNRTEKKEDSKTNHFTQHRSLYWLVVILQCPEVRTSNSSLLKQMITQQCTPQRTIESIFLNIPKCIVGLNALNRPWIFAGNTLKMLSVMPASRFSLDFLQCSLNINSAKCQASHPSIFLCVWILRSP